MRIQESPEYDLQKLTDSMMTFVDESEDEIIHLIGIMKLLLDGNPVSPERIAAELKLSEDEINTLLRVAELNKEGDIVGLGLSLVPTPHSYRIDGGQFYAWCAADAIMFPILLESRENAVIESSDPITGGRVRLIATPEGLKDVEPDRAVVSHPTVIENLLTVRADVCNATHFFTSVETASKYVARQPGFVTIPVDDVFQLWRQVWASNENLERR